MVRLIGVESLVSGICLRKRRIAVRGIVLKNGSPDSHSESVIGFKTEPFKPTDEKDSNAKVTDGATTTNQNKQDNPSRSVD